MNFTAVTFDEIAEGVDQAMSWFTSIGIPVSGTRLEAISARIGDLHRDFEDGGIDHLNKNSYEHKTSLILADALAFSLIASQFRALGPNLIPKKNLKTILSGPLFVKDEDPSQGEVNARNIFFELELAAELMRRDITVHGFDDIYCTFHGGALHMQCKRLHSERNVESNFERALGQLGRCMASKNDRGVVALAIERVTPLGDLLFYFDSDESFGEASKELTTDFIRCFPECTDIPSDPRIIGLLVVIRMITYCKTRKVFGRGFLWSMVPLFEEKQSGASEAKLLLQRFNEATNI